LIWPLELMNQMMWYGMGKSYPCKTRMKVNVK